MGCFEGDLELLDSLANFGNKRNNWDVLVRFTADAFLTDKYGVLQFSAQNHLHNFVKGLRRLLNAIADALLHKKLRLFLLFYVLQLDFGQHIAT